MDVQTERIIAKKGNALFENEETWLGSQCYLAKLIHILISNKRKLACRQYFYDIITRLSSYKIICVLNIADQSVTLPDQRPSHFFFLFPHSLIAVISIMLGKWTTQNVAKPTAFGCENFDLSPEFPVGVTFLSFAMIAFFFLQPILFELSSTV